MILTMMTNKGGVGKSSLTVNLASAAALKSSSSNVLIIDTDGQGNSSLSFGLKPNSIFPTIYDCMVDGVKAKKAITEITSNLHILPANDTMNFFELDTLPALNGRNPFDFLGKVLKQLEFHYDLIFVDAPPDMKMVAGNVIKAADVIYIPFEPELYSVQGLIQVIQKVKDFQHRAKVKTRIGGVIGSRVKRRTKLHQDMLSQAKAFCNKKDIPFLETVIPDSIRIPEAARLHKKPIVLANPDHEISKIYFDLLEEVVENGA